MWFNLNFHFRVSHPFGVTHPIAFVKELKKHGILSILTPPEKLTINAVDKYLELKASQAIQIYQTYFISSGFHIK